MVLIDGVWARASMWACHNDPKDPNVDQQVFNQGGYTFENGIDTQVQFRKTWKGKQYCLDVEGGNAVPGANVRWWECAHDVEKSTNKFFAHKIGWGEDRNGQDLNLWPCHDGPEQKFDAADPGAYATNVLWDLQKECSAKSVDQIKYCTYQCPTLHDRKRGAAIVIGGVTAVCGLLGPFAALACGTFLPWVKLEIEDAPCGCHCGPWDPPRPRPGPGRPPVDFAKNNGKAAEEVALTLANGTVIMVPERTLIASNTNFARLNTNWTAGLVYTTGTRPVAKPYSTPTDLLEKARYDLSKQQASKQESLAETTVIRASPQATATVRAALGSK
ncbi:hypothetical protein GGF31_002011 [Allomyces arbusculus]|nr:hypothetical protein GGF31_002011 [Allomyces arbusculus]